MKYKGPLRFPATREATAVAKQFVDYFVVVEETKADRERQGATVL